MISFVKKWIGFGAFLGLIGLLNWALPHFVKPEPNAPITKNTVDEYMIGAKAIRFDKQGKLAEKLYVAEISHLLTQEYMQLTAPKLIMNRDNLTWVIQAQSGKSFHPKDEPFERIELEQGVQIQLIQDPPHNWVLNTDKLTLLPREEKAITESEVNIHTDGLTIEGQGMLGDMKLGQIDINSQVKTTYGPT